jgi:hypothetical protein
MELTTWVPVVGIIAALLAPTLATVVGVIMSNRNAKRAAVAAESVAHKLDQTDEKTSQKLEVIHTLVNARLEAALAKIDLLEARLFDAESHHPIAEPPRGPIDPT